jgi:hypothetical protein
MLKWDRSPTDKPASERDYVLIRKSKAAVDHRRTYMREYMRRRAAARRDKPGLPPCQPGQAESS